jgi:hypothetical protein
VNEATTAVRKESEGATHLVAVAMEARIKANRQR